VSLRLRILLLIAAVNVGVLLLVVWLGLETADRVQLVGPAAVEEALRYASSERPEEFQRHATSFLVKVGGPSEAASVERYNPPELLQQAESAGNRLLKLHELGLPVFRIERHGVTMVRYDRRSRDSYYVRFNERARREALQPLRTIYILLAAGTLLLILGSYLILSVVILRPMEQLIDASRLVAEGQPPPPVPRPRGHSEVARLIDTFNRMATEVTEYQKHLEERVMSALDRVTAAEKRLVVAQRLSATGTLAAGFAHEINNPVGGILNAIKKLREGGLSGKRRDEYFDLVRDGIDRIRTIVDRILHFTPGHSQPRSLDAAEICQRAAALAAHRAEGRAVNIEVRADERAPVIGDDQELVQAVLNLVLNAVDAIPEGRGGRVQLVARRVGDEVFLEVVDDGIGMDPETARRCVDFFFSTKPEGEGTGLGLAIVQHIVTDHGGSLEIESDQGRGTTVRIRLPAESAA
jgi:signal transduction histidine kinase